MARYSVGNGRDSRIINLLNQIVVGFSPEELKFRITINCYKRKIYALEREHYRN